jgi:hypothetical protein
MANIFVVPEGRNTFGYAIKIHLPIGNQPHGQRGALLIAEKLAEYGLQILDLLMGNSNCVAHQRFVIINK